MTVKEIADKLSLKVLTQEGLDREVNCVYTCDLLSFAMGKAPADSAWVTVMGNVNAIAVAVLADVGCIILASGATLDETAKSKAISEGVPVLFTDNEIFPIAKAIDGLL